MDLSGHRRDSNVAVDGTLVTSYNRYRRNKRFAKDVLISFNLNIFAELRNKIY